MQSSIYERIIQFMMISMFVFCFLVLIRTKLILHRSVIACVIWIIYSLIVNISNFSNSPFSLFFVVTQSLWWPVAFIVFFYFNKNAGIFDFFIKKYSLFLFIVTFFICIYLIFLFSGNYDLTKGVVVQDQINSIYWPLFLIPLVINSNNKRISYLLPLLILIIFSTKRAPLIAIVMISINIALFYIIKLNLKSIILLILSGAIFFGSIIKITENVELNATDRILETEVENEPRFIFILDSYERYIAKDITKKIFGSGYRSTAIDRGGILSKTTHNDFLEIIYSYGIFGFIIFLWVLLRITPSFSQISQLNKKEKVLLYNSFILFLMISLVSHLTLYPSYFLTILFIWSGINAKSQNFTLNSYRSQIGQ